MSSAALVEDLNGGIKLILAEQGADPDAVFFEDNHRALKLCLILEQILSHRLASMHIFQKTTFWDFVKHLPACLPSKEIQEKIGEIVELGKSDIGRGRLFLRVALNDGALHEFLSALIWNQEILAECYEPGALLRNEEQASVVLLLIENLSKVKFRMFLKDPKLDKVDYWSTVRFPILYAPPAPASQQQFSSSHDPSPARHQQHHYIDKPVETPPSVPAVADEPTMRVLPGPSLSTPNVAAAQKNTEALSHQIMLDELKEAIRPIVASTEIITSSSPDVPRFFEALESIFDYKFQDSSALQIIEFGKSILNSANVCFWSFLDRIDDCLPEGAALKSSALEEATSVTTNLGRARVFFCSCLNDNSLAGTLRSLLWNAVLTEQYYLPGALLRDPEQVSIVLMLLDSMSTVTFGLKLNDPEYDDPTLWERRKRAYMTAKTDFHDYLQARKTDQPDVVASRSKKLRRKAAKLINLDGSQDDQLAVAKHNPAKPSRRAKRAAADAAKQAEESEHVVDVSPAVPVAEPVSSSPPHVHSSPTAVDDDNDDDDDDDDTAARLQAAAMGSLLSSASAITSKPTTEHVDVAASPLATSPAALAGPDSSPPSLLAVLDTAQAPAPSIMANFDDFYQEVISSNPSPNPSSSLSTLPSIAAFTSVASAYTPPSSAHAEPISSSPPTPAALLSSSPGPVLNAPTLSIEPSPPSLDLTAESPLPSPHSLQFSSPHSLQSSSPHSLQSSSHSLQSSSHSLHSTSPHALPLLLSPHSPPSSTHSSSPSPPDLRAAPAKTAPKPVARAATSEMGTRAVESKPRNKAQSSSDEMSSDLSELPTLSLTTYIRGTVVSSRCKGCGTILEEKGIIIKKVKARFCYYTGGWYCYDCHRNDTSIIPGAVVLRWDFALYPVSSRSAQNLAQLRPLPLVDINRDNPELYRMSPELNNMRKYRARLLLIAEFCQACERSAETLLTHIKAYAYLVQEIHTYSLADLDLVRRKKLGPMLQSTAQYFLDHIFHCAVCRGRGFYCAKCQNGELLFPFESGKFCNCPQCGAGYHQRCFKAAAGEQCVQCQQRSRLRERRAPNASD